MYWAIWAHRAVFFAIAQLSCCDLAIVAVPCDSATIVASVECARPMAATGYDGALLAPTTAATVTCVSTWRVKMKIVIVLYFGHVSYA